MDNLRCFLQDTIHHDVAIARSCNISIAEKYALAYYCIEKSDRDRRVGKNALNVLGFFHSLSRGISLPQYTKMHLDIMQRGVVH